MSTSLRSSVGHPDPVELDFTVTRALVPTERQRVGASPGQPPALAEDDSRFGRDTDIECGVAATLWQRIRGGLDAVNPAKIEGPKTPLFVFAASSALGGWSSAMLGLAAPEIQATFGVSVTAMVAISSVTGFFTMVTGLPLGYLVDRVNRVILVRIAQVSAPIGDVICALAPSYGVFLSGELGSEIARTPGAGADMPLLADYYSSRSRARVYAFLDISSMLGGLISVPLLGVMLEHFGWRQSTLVLAAMSTVVALLTFRLREPRRGTMDRLDAGVEEEYAGEEPPPPSISEALRAAWQVRSLRMQAVAGMVGSFTVPLAMLTSLILASKFALGPEQRSLISLAQIVAMIPFSLIGAAIADRLLAVKPASVAILQGVLALISGFVMVGQAFAPDLTSFVILSVLPACLGAILDPVSSSISSMVVPPRVRGVGMQVFTPFGLVGLIVAPVLIKTAEGVNLSQAFLYFTPFLLLSGLMYIASSAYVTADIRAARAAAVTEGQVAELGENAPTLICRDVEVAYGDTVILDSVDFHVDQGETVALVGTNGAGKSSLLRAICGLEMATNGAIFFEGHDLTAAPAHEFARRGLVYMPGGHGIFNELTAREHLMLVRACQGPDSDRSAPADLVAEAVALFPGLERGLDLPAKLLSGGEQQMLALACSMLARPHLLLIDELSLGLAPSIVEELVSAVRRINRSGTSLVLVEQSLNIATAFADRLVFMDAGRIVFDGSPVELSTRPELARALFLGGGGPRVRTRSRRWRASQATAALSATGLTVEYGSHTALDHATLEVMPGEVLGVIGPNGAGKTTLFDALSGHQTISDGRVFLGRVELTDLPPHERARVGLSRAFQESLLFGPLTVAENIAVALERRSRTFPLGALLWLPRHLTQERRLWDRVDGYLQVMGLGPHADKPIDTVSTGTRRAVEIACQLAMEPTVLLLDEPSSGLAQAEVEGLGPALQQIVRDTGCAVVLIEHDLGLLHLICDRLLAMDQGRVITSGPPAEVLDHPLVRDDYAAASALFVNRSGAVTSSPHTTPSSASLDTRPGARHDQH